MTFVPRAVIDSMHRGRNDGLNRDYDGRNLSKDFHLKFIYKLFETEKVFLNISLYTESFRIFRATSVLYRHLLNGTTSPKL